MSIETKIIEKKNKLCVEIPLTIPKSKIRLKERDSFYKFGKFAKPRKDILSNKNYVEWQIGYDALISEIKKNKKHTSLMNFVFYSYNKNKKREKRPYELSEILYYAYKKKILDKKSIIYKYKKVLKIKDFVDTDKRLGFNTSNKTKFSLNECEFKKISQSFPTLFYEYDKYSLYSEISIKENQVAAGIQPMLYVCLPLTELQFDEEIFGRTLKTKETATWVIEKKEIKFILEIFYIFAMLSENHKRDVISIFKCLFKIKEEK